VRKECHTGSGLQNIFLIALKYAKLKKTFDGCAQNQQYELRRVEGSECFEDCLLSRQRNKDATKALETAPRPLALIGKE
jgi:hypothetical protein